MPAANGAGSARQRPSAGNAPTLSWNADCSFANSLKLITGSATVTLPTIPRATTPSVGTLTMGSQSTITLSPASNSFTHTLRYQVGTANGNIVTKTSNTTVNWTPPRSLANQAPNSTTAVPVGVDSQDRDLCDPEMTGGEKTVTLTTANMPAHTHALSSGTATAAEAAAHTHQAASGTYKVGSGSGSNYKYLTNGGSTDPATTGSGGGHTHTITLSGNTGSKGSGTAHSNMQPYITCYFYKRTA